MASAAISLEIRPEVMAMAKRTADLDNVDVSTLVESLVIRHVEYVESFSSDPELGMPKFSLDEYEMIRDPGETDEEYEGRLNLFR